MNSIVIGIGNAGINILNKVITSNIRNLDYLALDIDRTDLDAALSPKKLLLPSILDPQPGNPLVPQIGQIGIYDRKEEITKYLNGINKAIILAGMGGNCGTGAVIELSKILTDLSIPTFAIVTTPFNFEGAERQQIAEEGISNLRKILDNVIVIRNEDIKKSIDGKVTFARAFAAVDNIALQSLHSYINNIL